MRADLAVSKALNISRNQAAGLIENGVVLADSKIIKKASQEIDKDQIIEVKSQIYVSRAALKLAGFLDEIKLNLKDKIDINDVVCLMGAGDMDRYYEKLIKSFN